MTIYYMRAFNTELSHYVNWAVNNTPDNTGIFSGHPTHQLRNISINYVNDSESVLDPALFDPHTTLSNDIAANLNYTNLDSSIKSSIDHVDIGFFVTYDEGVYQAALNNTLPAIIISPGYHKTHASVPLSARQRLASYGFLVIAMGNRESPDDLGREIYDVKDILNYISANHTKVSNRYFRMGYGMGGGQALMSQLRFPDLFSGLATFSPINDLHKDTNDSMCTHHCYMKEDVEQAVGVARNNQVEPYTARSARLGGGLALAAAAVPIWAFSDSDNPIQFCGKGGTPNPNGRMRDAIMADGAAYLLHYHHSNPDTADNLRFHSGEANQFAGNNYAERFFIPSFRAVPKPQMKVKGALNILGWAETDRFSIWLGDQSDPKNNGLLTPGGVKHALKCNYDMTGGIFKFERITKGNMFVNITLDNKSTELEIPTDSDSFYVDIDTVSPIFHLGYSLAGTSAVNKMTSSDHLNFAPGKSLFLILDNYNGHNNKDFVLGCGKGDLQHVERKGWSINLMSDGLSLMGAGSSYSKLTAGYGIQVICLRWQADHQVYVSVNGGVAKLAGTTDYKDWHDLCQTSLGSPFVGDTISTPWDGGILGFAVVDRELSDAELQASVNYGENTRLRIPNNIVAESSTIWEATVDWDGHADASPTRGTSPITLNKVGAPLHFNVSESRVAINDDIILDTKSAIPASNFTYRDEFGRVRALTSAKRVGVDAYLTPGATYSKFGVWKNGSFSKSTEVAVDTLGCQDIDLGSQLNKIVDIVGGVQNFTTGSYATGMKGVYLRAVRIRSNEPSFAMVSPEKPDNRAIVLGDNLLSGFGSNDPMSDSAVLLLRNSLDGSITNISYGGANLDYYTSGTINSVSQTANLITSACDGKMKNTILIELGSNDFSAGLAASAYQTQLNNLCLDLESRNIQGLRILLFKPIQRISPANESANTAGSTLNDFRMAMDNVSSMNASVRTSIGGVGIVSNSNMAANGLDVKTAGNQELHDYLLSEINF